MTHLLLRAKGSRLKAGNDGEGSRVLPQQAQPQILRHVRVLIFVYQDVAEAALVLAQHFGLLAEQPDAFEQ